MNRLLVHRNVAAGCSPRPLASKPARKAVVRCALRFFSKPPATNSSNTLPHPQKLRLSPSLKATTSQRGVSVADRDSIAGRIRFQGVHHVGLLCENLEESLKFYKDTLGLEENPDRPHHKLPYRGAWLWIGPEMIHLMELPDPDPKDNRPEHGGRDRHFCVGVADLKPLIARLDAGNVKYTTSMSGRPAVFFRDPDMNCLEVAEMGEWR